MKKLATITAAGLLIIGLAGCSTAAPPTYQPAPAAPVEPAPEAEPEPVITDEELYVLFVRTEEPTLNAVPDSDLIALGYATCEAFDNGVSVYDMAQSVIENGLELEGGTLIGGAVGAFCPEHTEKLG